jgi:hypothetical protein
LLGADWELKARQGNTGKTCVFQDFDFLPSSYFIMGILQIAAYVPAKKWYISKSGIKGPTQFRGNMLFTHINMSQNAGW